MKAYFPDMTTIANNELIEYGRFQERLLTRRVIHVSDRAHTVTTKSDEPSADLHACVWNELIIPSVYLRNPTSDV